MLVNFHKADFCSVCPGERGRCGEVVKTLHFWLNVGLLLGKRLHWPIFRSFIVLLLLSGIFRGEACLVGVDRCGVGENNDELYSLSGLGRRGVSGSHMSFSCCWKTTSWEYSNYHQDYFKYKLRSYCALFVLVQK